MATSDHAFLQCYSCIFSSRECGFRPAMEGLSFTQMLQECNSYAYVYIRFVYTLLVTERPPRCLPSATTNFTNHWPKMTKKNKDDVPSGNDSRVSIISNLCHGYIPILFQVS